MKYAYYPGCSAHSTVRDMHESAVIVAGTLGIDLVEPAGWTCCGVQVIAERYSSKPVYAGLDTAFLGILEERGVWTGKCSGKYRRRRTGPPVSTVSSESSSAKTTESKTL